MVAHTSTLFISVIDSMEGWDAAVINIPGPLHTNIDKEMYMVLEG